MMGKGFRDYFRVIQVKPINNTIQIAHNTYINRRDIADGKNLTGYCGQIDP